MAGLKILSPDGRLAAEVGLEDCGGHAACVFRVLLGRHAILSRSVVLAASEPTGEIETRDLVGRGGRVLARELTVRFRRGQCVFRVADDAFAVLPVGRGIYALPRFAPALSAGYTPALATDGRVGYEILPAAKCRQMAQALRGLLFLSNGKCAAVAASLQARVFILTAADRPVDAVLPRGLRPLLRGLPPSVTRRLAAGDMPPASLPPGDAAFNIAAFFLNFGYLFDAARAAGAPIDGALTTFYHLDPRLPAVFANPAAAVTPAHAEAFAILSDPARGEAAAGFRGEWGEYVCGARRQGRVWLVAGVTVKLRVLTLFFPYLEEGVRYRATWTLDAGADLPTNAVNPTPATVAAGDKAMVRMNPDGGFVLRLEPMG